MNDKKRKIDPIELENRVIPNKKAKMDISNDATTTPKKMQQRMQMIIVPKESLMKQIWKEYENTQNGTYPFKNDSQHRYWVEIVKHTFHSLTFMKYILNDFNKMELKLNENSINKTKSELQNKITAETETETETQQQTKITIPFEIQAIIIQFMDISEARSPLMCECCGYKADSICGCETLICDGCVRFCQKCVKLYYGQTILPMCVFCMGDNKYCRYCIEFNDDILSQSNYGSDDENDNDNESKEEIVYKKPDERWLRKTIKFTAFPILYKK